jgi:uncharacterized membrane protein YeaQ/YmgE (transglycosylase-associated protein family)
MDDNSSALVASIVVGCIAEWLAEIVTGSNMNMGLLTNK